MQTFAIVRWIWALPSTACRPKVCPRCSNSLCMERLKAALETMPPTIT